MRCHAHSDRSGLTALLLGTIGESGQDERDTNRCGMRDADDCRRSAGDAERKLDEQQRRFDDECRRIEMDSRRRDRDRH